MFYTEFLVAVLSVSFDNTSNHNEIFLPSSSSTLYCIGQGKKKLRVLSKRDRFNGNKWTPLLIIFHVHSASCFIPAASMGRMLGSLVAKMDQIPHINTILFI